MLSLVVLQGTLWVGLLLVGLLFEALALRGGAGPRRLLNVANGTVAFAASMAAAAALSRLPVGGPLLRLPDAAPGVAGLPATIGAALLWVALYDLCYYAWHRAQHAFAPLWHLHAVHHGDDAFDVTTYLRQHWLEGPAQGLLIGLPLGRLVQPSAGAAVLAIALASVVEFASHLDLPLRLGRLSALVTGPELHRSHHVADRGWSGSNFAAVLPLWDVAFGTWRHPAAAAGLPVGAIGAPARSLRELLALPWPPPWPRRAPPVVVGSASAGSARWSRRRGLSARRRRPSP